MRTVVLRQHGGANRPMSLEPNICFAPCYSGGPLSLFFLALCLYKKPPPASFSPLTGQRISLLLVAHSGCICWSIEGERITSCVSREGMSCNGCRVLRKGCSDACVLRPSIEWIDGAQPQANATVFVAKFFGRAGLVASLAAVPLQHRPALFRSLLYEACGRTINPVSGAIGLMWTGNWDLCQAAAEAVLHGDSLRALSAIPAAFTERDMAGLYGDVGAAAAASSCSPEHSSSAPSRKKRRGNTGGGHYSFAAAANKDECHRNQMRATAAGQMQPCELHLCLTTPASPHQAAGGLRGGGASDEYSATTTCEDAGGDAAEAGAPTLLNLFC